MNELKKISVIGAGAIGTLLGGLIKHHRADLELVLITRGAHRDRMQETGRAELQGFWGCRGLLRRTNRRFIKGKASTID